MTQYDYIIVGAGSAGCVLAERLSSDPKVQVLILEAGGHDRSPMVQVPKALVYTRDLQWKYSTQPFGPFGQVEPWSRGKLLGGSSSVNGMVYNRGAAADYDRIVELGNPGWGWSDMLPIFRSMENHSLGASATRGAGGPLGVSVAALTEPVSQALADSGAALGAQRMDDVNASDDERIGAAPATIWNGRRVSASRAFLRPALKRDNLTLRTGVHALHVVFEGDRAVGVHVEVGGRTEVVHSRHEVVLAMGSLETPRILELSGIGGRETLKPLGIDVRVDAARVGEGVHEHRCFPLQVRLRENLGYNKQLGTLPAQAMAALRYLATRGGPLAKPAYDMLWFTRTTPEAQRPDGQVLLTPFSMGVGATKPGLETRPGFSLLGFVLRPDSEGSIHITSGDPHAPAAIQPNYLATDHDRETSIRLFKRMRELVQQSPIADLALMEIQPGTVVQDDESILRSGFLYGGPGYHACGSVPMGPTDDHPIDSRLRVRGVRGLRVVDVSILPEMVAGNLNGPIMAMAWRASEMIREDAVAVAGR